MTLREIFLSKFSPKLLALKAFVYQRQSSLKQLQENTGSTMYQENLARIPAEIGFAPERIEIIDCDTATSGEAVEHRQGFQHLLASVQQGLVGLVVVGDLSRANRKAKDQFELFEYCKIFKVALWYDERLHDVTDISELLSMQVTAVVNENSNLRRRADMLRGRYAKAENGDVASALPRGFVNVGGRIEKDPDPAVQESIVRIIREFLKQRKVRPTWLALLAAGVQLPIRKKQRLQWVKPSQAAIRYILTNPIYGGRYHFRRFIADPRLGRDRKGHWRTRPATPDEIISSPAVFEGYMSWEEFLEVQAILDSHRDKHGHKRSTDGPALCQGMLSCAEHPRYVMSPKPKNGQRLPQHSWVYRCNGTYFEGGPQCITVAAVYIDPYVTEAIVAQLAPPRLEIAREEYKRAKRGEDSEKYRLECELERVSARVRRLSYLYENEAPEHSAVRRKLAEEWDSLIREEERLRHALTSVRPTKGVFDDDAAFAEFLVLCRDVRTLFGLASTLEKKEIVRCLVSKVLLESCTPERLRLRLVWQDGRVDQVIEVKRWGYATGLIKDRRARGVPVCQIARELNELGVLNRKHGRWTAQSVSQRLCQLRRAGHLKRGTVESYAGDLKA
jgi:DNA invertase Pin-like site-specific DNA recombinase